MGADTRHNPVGILGIVFVAIDYTGSYADQSHKADTISD